MDILVWEELGESESESEQKHTTKNFVGFHNLSPLLTMFCGNLELRC